MCVLMCVEEVYVDGGLDLVRIDDRQMENQEERAAMGFHPILHMH